MRLIDADELRSTIENEHFGEYEDKETVFYCIDTAHTVDAMVVVRCKDCKYRYSDSWCKYVDDDDNFYCARGKRKEGAD